MAAEIGVLAGERLQDLANSGPRELHRILFAGILAKRSWYQNFSHRSILPWALPSGQNPDDNCWRDRSAHSLPITRHTRTRSRSFPDRAAKSTHRNPDANGRCRLAP